jgi:hypothetical protein
MPQVPAVASSPQDVSAQLGQLRATANELKLRVSDLDQRRSQLIENKSARRNEFVDRPALDKLIAGVQHDLTAAQIQLETTNAQIEELQTQRDMNRMFAFQGPPSTIATTAPPAPPIARDPVRDFVLSDGFGLASFLLLFPFAVAMARRVWMRSGARPRTVDLENSPRLQRIEQAVEAIAVEVERIGEAQRFTTKLLSDRQADAAQRVVVQPRREAGTITPH